MTDEQRGIQKLFDAFDELREEWRKVTTQMDKLKAENLRLRQELEKIAYCDTWPAGSDTMLGQLKALEDIARRALE
jgi:seryl-tRNA synthetase